MSEYRVKISIRNNLMLSAVEAAGYGERGGITRFCEDAGIAPTDFYALSGLKRSPLTNDGEFSTAARKVMEFLGAAPSDLWTDEQLTLEIEKNSAVFNVSSAEVRAMLDWRENRPTDPEQIADDSMTRRLVERLVSRLPGVSANVLRLRFGLGDTPNKSLEECAQMMGITRERVRQIEAKALRKVRELIHEEGSTGLTTG